MSEKHWVLPPTKVPASKEPSEVDNRLENIHFADLSKETSQWQVFLIRADFELDGMTSHKHGKAAKYSLFQNGGMRNRILSFLGDEFLHG